MNNIRTFNTRTGSHVHQPGDFWTIHDGSVLMSGPHYNFQGRAIHVPDPIRECTQRTRVIYDDSTHKADVLAYFNDRFEAVVEAYQAGFDPTGVVSESIVRRSGYKSQESIRAFLTAARRAAGLAGLGPSPEQEAEAVRKAHRGNQRVGPGLWSSGPAGEFLNGKLIK